MAKILIVDDTEGIRKMLIRQLTKFEYEVVGAEGGNEALKLLRSKKVDLILLDQMMPEMDGLETYERIKTDVADCLPVIMITAHGSLNLAVTFLKKGGADFLEKPIDIEVLDFKIKQALNMAKLHASLFKEQVALKAAKKAAKLKDEFLTSMSHELRSPLTAIMGFSERIPVKINKREIQKAISFAGDIQKSAGHLLELINDILDFAKIEAGEMDIVKEKISIHEMGDNLISMFKSIAEEKSIELKCYLPDNLPFLNADRKRLMQVMVNLVSNAIKFTPEGGMIKISATDGDEIILMVEDSGIGIAPEEHEIVFTRFGQVGRSKKEQQGTGLGLVISKEIVELLGGKIWLESKSGEGSRFYVSLPVF